MKISDIASQILQSSEKARELGEKYINGLVKERLILRDYYNVFGKESINEEEEEEEIELEPEKIVVDDEEPIQQEPEAEVEIPDEEFPEDEVEDEEEVEEPEIEPEPAPDAEIDSQTVIGTKKPEGDGYIRISPTEAQELLSYKGKIFQAVFTKKNGELRAMNGMTGVRKYTSGGELPYSPKDKGVIPVYDLKIGMGPKGYRMINVEGLKTLHINGKKFKIDQTLREIKVNEPFKLIQGKKYQIPDTIDNNGNVENWLTGIYTYQAKKEDGTIELVFNIGNGSKHWYHSITYNNLNNLENRPKLINENMKRSQLREFIKQTIQEIRGNQPHPSTPDRETIEKPDIDTPTTPKRRRRTLTPPEHVPDTAPKAEGVEKDLSLKMGKRFINTKLK